MMKVLKNFLCATSQTIKTLFFCTFFLLFSLLLLPSCKKERNYELLEISKMVSLGDPEMKTVLGAGMAAGIQCSDYGPGCLSARKILVKKVEMGVIEFQNSEQARVVAKKIDQYYLGNWVFDDVVGEPVLENFLKKFLNAKRPSIED